MPTSPAAPAPRPLVAATTVVSAALFVLAASAGWAVAVAMLVVLGAVLAWGWPLLLDLPVARNTSIVLAAATIAVAIVDVTADDADGVKWIPAAIAICLVLAFLLELSRRDGRDRLVVSLAGASFGLAIVASAGFLAPTLSYADGDVTMRVAVLAAAASAVAEFALARSSRWLEWALPVSMALGTAIGLVAAVITGASWTTLWLTGIIAAAASLAVRQIVRSLPDARIHAAQLATGAASVMVVGVVAYLAAWLLNR